MNKRDVKSLFDHELEHYHQELQHAVQTGVLYDRNRDDLKEGGKHLRVGVSTAMVDHASLVKLLIDKGVITDREYLEAICTGMELEVKRLEEYLGTQYRCVITLG